MPPTHGGSRQCLLLKSLRDEKAFFLTLFTPAMGTDDGFHRRAFAGARQASSHSFGWYGDAATGRHYLLGMGRTQYERNRCPFVADQQADCDKRPERSLARCGANT